MIKCKYDRCRKESTHRLFDNCFYCDNHGFPYRDRAVVLLLPNTTNNKILGVTRKNNNLDWGLPGGKVEPTDLNDEEALMREVYEECGVLVYNLIPIFTCLIPSKIVTTFVAGGFRGGIKNQPNEGKCGFIDRNLLLKGSFSMYNKNLFQHIGWNVK